MEPKLLSEYVKELKRIETEPRIKIKDFKKHFMLKERKAVVVLDCEHHDNVYKT